MHAFTKDDSKLSSYHKLTDTVDNVIKSKYKVANARDINFGLIQDDYWKMFEVKNEIAEW